MLTQTCELFGTEIVGKRIITMITLLGDFDFHIVLGVCEFLLPIWIDIIELSLKRTTEPQQFILMKSAILLEL